MSIARFTLWTSMLAVLLCGIAQYILAPTALLQPDAAVMVTIVLGGVTCLVYFFLTRPADPAAFTTNYLLTLVLKMVLFLALVGILAFMDSARVSDNVIFGFLAYVAFTVLEVLALYRHKSGTGRG